ncbi:hypothetical protein AP20H10_10580 [Apilactobacillus apinorum]|uniref:Uncharacterized protein n=1 Tax=Apilactobacillus apinorum TaxID=1218495 RepID=A0ABP9ZIQ7_9LACO
MPEIPKKAKNPIIAMEPTNILGYPLGICEKLKLPLNSFVTMNSGLYSIFGFIFKRVYDALPLLSSIKLGIKINDDNNIEMITDTVILLSLIKVTLKLICFIYRENIT